MYVSFVIIIQKYKIVKDIKLGGIYQLFKVYSNKNNGGNVEPYNEIKKAPYITSGSICCMT